MKKSSQKISVAQSMAQTARLLKVHLSEVKRAKRSGAKAFMRSGRVHLGKLKRWLTRNPVIPHKSKTPPSQPLDLGTLEKSLQGAVQVEQRNLQLLQEAQTRGDAMAAEALTAAYSRSQKNRLLAERDVRKQKLEAGQLLTSDEHKIQLHRLYAPLVSTVRQIPRKVATQLGGDDVRTEKIVSEIVEAALADCRKTINPKPEDAHFCFTLWLALIVREDPTGAAAVTKIRAALSEVEAAIAETAKAQNPPDDGKASNEG
ncbi:MAG: hypothetical protein LV481_04640 [Methylacidiphilales bacterium]|nr:hypothetical protein [Candidatus Methylacidiphilales bacterium]